MCEDAKAAVATMAEVVAAQRDVFAVVSRFGGRRFLFLNAGSDVCQGLIKVMLLTRLKFVTGELSTGGTWLVPGDRTEIIKRRE